LSKSINDLVAHECILDLGVFKSVTAESARQLQRYTGVGQPVILEITVKEAGHDYSHEKYCFESLKLG
jgi:hypothetical protein